VPYFKCMACRIRLSGANVSSDGANVSSDVFDAGCPGCGRPWQPSTRAADLLGYRLAAPPPTNPAAAGEGLWRLAARVAEVRNEDLP
jgi:hypothetical protein